MSWVMKAGKQEKADSPGTGLGEHSLPSQPLETMEKSNLHTQNQDSYCWWHVGKKKLPPFESCATAIFIGFQWG